MNDLPSILRAAGRRLPRTKHQRPEVYPWQGKRGKRWKVEYRVYDEIGKPIHRSATWDARQYTKTEAQKAADELIARETVKRIEGTMTVAQYWERAFWPALRRTLTRNSENNYASRWRRHILPVIGSMRLLDVQKADIDRALGKIADAGMGESTANCAYVIIHGLLDEAHEEGYIPRNPARRVKVPTCKPNQATVPLTHEQAAALLAGTKGRTRLVWWIILTTGARIGEVLALTRDDIRGEELRIDESTTQGRANRTKSKKVRFAPLAPRLRAELLAWLEGHQSNLVFPSEKGTLLQRHNSSVAKVMVEAARKASGVPDLTFRAGRTTFSTLYQGDVKDLQATLGHASLDITLGVYRKPIHERGLASVTEMEGKLLEMPRKRK